MVAEPQYIYFELMLMETLFVCEDGSSESDALWIVSGFNEVRRAREG